MCIPFCNEDEEKRLHPNILETDAGNLTVILVGAI
jgi:hypothetical protein